MVLVPYPFLEIYQYPLCQAHFVLDNQANAMATPPPFTQSMAPGNREMDEEILIQENNVEGRIAEN